MIFGLFYVFVQLQEMLCMSSDDDKIISSSCIIFQDISKNTVLQDVSGKKMYAMKVFSSVFKFLKDFVLGVMEKQGINNLTEDEIKWVITVPAIWSNKAKQFMKESNKAKQFMKEAAVQVRLILNKIRIIRLYFHCIQGESSIFVIMFMLHI